MKTKTAGHSTGRPRAEDPAEAHVGAIGGTALLFVLSLGLSVGLPVAFFFLWLGTAQNSALGDAPFYFPTSIWELVWLLALLFSLLPCAIVTLVLSGPLALAFHTLGMPVVVDIPHVEATPQGELALVVGAALGVLAQALIWWGIVAVGWASVSQVAAAAPQRESSRGYTLWYVSRRRRARTIGSSRVRRRRG